MRVLRERVATLEDHIVALQDDRTAHRPQQLPPHVPQVLAAPVEHRAPVQPPPPPTAQHLPCTVILEGGEKHAADLAMVTRAPWSMPEVLTTILTARILPRLDQDRLDSVLFCVERDGVRTIVDNPRGASQTVLSTDKMFIVLLTGDGGGAAAAAAATPSFAGPPRGQHHSRDYPHHAVSTAPVSAPPQRPSTSRVSASIFWNKAAHRDLTSNSSAFPWA